MIISIPYYTTFAFTYRFHKSFLLYNKMLDKNIDHNYSNINIYIV